jgi:hypothetical protein
MAGLIVLFVVLVELSAFFLCIKHFRSSTSKGLTKKDSIVLFSLLLLMSFAASFSVCMFTLSLYQGNQVYAFTLLGNFALVKDLIFVSFLMCTLFFLRLLDARVLHILLDCILLSISVSAIFFFTLFSWALVFYGITVTNG